MILYYQVGCRTSVAQKHAWQSNLFSGSGHKALVLLKAVVVFVYYCQRIIVPVVQTLMPMDSVPVIIAVYVVSVHKCPWTLFSSVVL